MANTFKNARAVIQTTTTVAYTCPAATVAIVVGCQVANVSAASEEVSTNLQTVASAVEEMSASIKEIARSAAEAAQVASQAVSSAERTNRTVSKLGESSAAMVVAEFLPVAFMMLMFLGIMTAGQMLVTTTVEEKSSRVVEVLLAAVSPTQLMAGKILGQLGVGMLMMSVYAGLGVLALLSFALTGLLEFWQLALFALFFLIAFAMLSTAMRRNPSATSSGLPGAVPVAAAISVARASSLARTTVASSGSVPSGPNTAGKCAGEIRPSIRLQSVMVSGPPRR